MTEIAIESGGREQALKYSSRVPGGNTAAVCIPRFFENQAITTPDAWAVTYKDERLTYAELNRRANLVAWHLRSVGVSPDSLVAVYLDRSIEFIVAIIGILKAGGAYVPIDPGYPPERVVFMLQDTASVVGITQSRLVKNGSQRNVRFICLDRDIVQSRTQEAANLQLYISPENLAYVMYTSGSTGRPKGVCIKHGGVIRLVVGQSYFSSGPGKRFLQSAPLTFDASTFEIWAALLHGAELVLYPERDFTVQTLASVLRAAQISTLWLTPSVFNPIVDEDPRILAPVSELILGGEPLSPRHVHKAMSALPHLTIVNGYGPTENTDFTCCYRVPRTFPPTASSVPVGSSLRGDQIYILDQNLQPVGPRQTGELYVAGNGLARGYLNCPAQTARQFLPNRFSGRPGDRMYRTGDAARILEDGNIELLGRLDNQVKVSGFRIELGEVESAILRHPDVRQVAAAVVKDSGRADILVAYVALASGRSLSLRELREFLNAILPRFMLPSALVCLDALPLSHHGKIDRRALPHPSTARSRLTRGQSEAPQGPMEQLIAAAWSELLAIEEIGATDSFFDLGGTSLLVRQLQLKLQRLLQHDIPATSFFEHFTVRAFAKYLTQSEAADDRRVSAEGGSKLEPLAARVRYRTELRRQMPSRGGHS